MHWLATVKDCCLKGHYVLAELRAVVLDLLAASFYTFRLWALPEPTVKIAC